MKITAVEGLLLSCALPEPLRLPFWNGERTILKRDAMLIRVRTDKGLTGYAPGPAHERAAAEIREHIAPFLAGKDPRHWRTFNFTGPLELTKTYRAVEIALMDIAGKDAGLPISELIGGRKRDRIKLYGSAGMYMAPEKYAEEAAAVKGMGFPAYKMRPALGPDEDTRTVKLMREATGPNFGLMIDAHSWWRMGDKNYSIGQVARLAIAMASFNPVWLEEPLPPENHADYEVLDCISPVTIACGEHEQTEEGFADLIKRLSSSKTRIESGVTNFIQADVCCQGGFEMGRRIFEQCAKAKLRFAFHSWGTTLEVLAAAHSGICWDESVVEWLEYPCYSDNGRPGMYPFPAADEILAEPLHIERGHLHVPKKPGLGIEIDERVIEKYPFLPGPWSFFKINSPPETIAVTGDHSVKWIEGTAKH
ncbi:MAG TPA: mandelate racemase/muconate lactonizing enzyme family protein [Verrucomicrobiae bacterium]|jgi:L-alanine-DL-glutamate epimerase-like enolase superfamily enzyme